jgi:hypothetical protein
VTRSIKSIRTTIISIIAKRGKIRIHCDDNTRFELKLPKITSLVRYNSYNNCCAANRCKLFPIPDYNDLDKNSIGVTQASQGFTQTSGQGVWV